MPAVRSSVPKYCRFKPRNLAYVRINGRPRYLGKYNSPESLEAYQRIIAELKAAPAATIHPEALTAPATFTVVELCAAYLDFAEAYYVKNGEPSDDLYKVKIVLKQVRELYGCTPAAEFGPRKFKAVRDRLVEKGHRRQYVNKLMAIVSQLFKWAAAEELVPITVHQTLRAVGGLKRGRTAAPESAPVLPVDDAVVDATLPHLPPIVADMVSFQRLTGCRPGEVCILRPMDLDRRGKVWEYRPASHKTEHHGKERIIFIGPRAQVVLLPYLLRPADAYCFSPAETVAKHLEARRAARQTPASCGNRPGTNRKASPRRSPRDCYTTGSYGRAVHRCIDKANAAAIAETIKAGRDADQARQLPHWHLNQLRHSAGTEIRHEFGLEAAQVVLGHTKANVTQVYAERDHARAAEVMGKIG